MSNNTVEIRGLGDAIKRLIEVQAQLMNRWGDPTEMNKAETEMLLQALNQYELVITFDCDIDGGDDLDDDGLQVDLIKKSAKTKIKKGVSCCRIQPTEFTRHAKKPVQVADTFTNFVGIDIGLGEEPNGNPPKRKVSSRRKK